MSQSHNDANATPYACCLGAAYGRRCSPGCSHAEPRRAWWRWLLGWVGVS